MSQLVKKNISILFILFFIFEFSACADFEFGNQSLGLAEVGEVDTRMRVISLDGKLTVYIGDTHQYGVSNLAEILEITGNEDVNWSVEVGGSLVMPEDAATYGSIDLKSGLYTAPSLLPNDPYLTIVAQSPTHSYIQGKLNIIILDTTISNGSLSWFYYTNYEDVIERDENGNEVTKKQLSLYDGVTTINRPVYGSREIDILKLPDSVTKISTGAFSVNNLTELRIPPYVTIIDDSAFSKNPLQLVTIPQNFYNALLLQFYTFPNNSIVNFRLSKIFHVSGEYKIQDYTGKVLKEGVAISSFNTNEYSELSPDGSELTISDGVTYIEAETFAYKNIATLNLPDTLKEIRDGAFVGSSLVRVTIPPNVEVLRPFVFVDLSLKSSIRIVTMSADLFNSVKTKTYSVSESRVTGARGGNDTPYLHTIFGDDARYYDLQGSELILN